MAKKNVTVKVVLHPPGSPEPYHFESNDVPIDGDNVIYFINCGKSKGFLISYKLDDDDNPGWRFPTSATHGPDHKKEALWATETGPCPTTAQYWDDVFKAVSVTNGGETLIVSNENLVAQTFAYSLRLAKGGAWLLLDPGGNNQNGGLPLFSAYLSTTVAGAVCATGAAMFTGAELAPTDYGMFAIGGAIVGFVVGLIMDRF
jgi:hypothetical protein